MEEGESGENLKRKEGEEADMERSKKGRYFGM